MIPSRNYKVVAKDGSELAPIEEVVSAPEILSNFVRFMTVKGVVLIAKELIAIIKVV